MIMRKYVIVTCLIVFVISTVFCFEEKTEVRAKEKPLVLVLDPGHGGSQSGAARDNEKVEEKDLNLKIAVYLKQELESYENTEVYLTRTGDEEIELPERIQFALEKRADALISLHNNAAGPCAAYDHGCTVLAAKDGYKDALARKGQELSCNILNELTKLGLTNQGILTRDSEADERYPNQVLADYYAIIRGGVENDMLTVLVEHAFIDSNSDYKAYLSSDEKLKSLACADATGIARYYQLVKKSQEDTVDYGKCLLEPLKEYKEKLAKRKYPSIAYELAEQIQKETDKEVRITVPGHTQRGGSPCAYDRVFATRVGAKAAELILNEEYGYMVAMRNGETVKVPLEEVAGKLKYVDPQCGLIQEARMIGISFGDK